MSIIEHVYADPQHRGSRALTARNVRHARAVNRRGVARVGRIAAMEAHISQVARSLDRHRAARDAEILAEHHRAGAARIRENAAARALTHVGPPVPTSAEPITYDPALLTPQQERGLERLSRSLARMVGMR